MKKRLLIIFAFSFLTASSFAQTVEFFDDFESGTANWELTGTWGLTTTQSYSPSNSLTDSPGGNYGNDSLMYATMLNGVDLSSALSAELNFWGTYKIELGFDYMYVDISIDDFSTFTNIAIFDGEPTALPPFEEFTYSLGGFVGNNNVKARFRFVTDQAYATDGMYIDDFTITSFDDDLAAPLITFDKPIFYEGALDEYEFVATIVDISGVAQANCHYVVDGIAQTAAVSGTNTSGDEWAFVIPEQSPGAWVDFFIVAEDSSPAQNVATTDTSRYISGKYYSYDNTIVSFFAPVGPGSGNPTLTGVATMITLDDTETPVASLIRNYTDVNNPNDVMEVHLWMGDGSGPTSDLIVPITMEPEATLANTSAMARINLRPYNDEIANQSGVIFIGYTVPDGIVNTVTTSPAVAGQSFKYDNGTWVSDDKDYHFRLITDGGKLSSYNNNLDINFKVFPNPAHNYFRVRSEENIKYIQLYNLLGVNVDIKEVNKKEAFINTSTLERGIYILQLHTDKGIVTSKIEIHK